MQIHELDKYTGALGANAFTAIDNGSDTGKISISDLLKATNDNVAQLGSDLNARIDNIIAGGAAPSAAEVTDGRLGSGGFLYASLGDAIRAQSERAQETALPIYDEGELFTTELLANVSQYPSHGYKFITGKHYLIHVKGTTWTPPTNGGSYVLILRTTQTASFNAQTFENIIVIPNANVTSGLELFIPFTPTMDAPYISYFVASGTDVTVELTISETIFDDIETVIELNKEFALPRVLVYGRLIYNVSTDTYTENGAYGSTEKLISSEPLRVFTETANLEFSIRYPDTGESTLFTKDILIPPNTRFVIVIHRTDGSITSALIDTVSLFSTVEGYEDFRNKHYYKVKNTVRGSQDNLLMFGKLWSDASLLGMRQYSSENPLTTKFSRYIMYCEADLDIYVTPYAATEVDVYLLDGTLLTTIGSEEKYTVPANTEFIINARNGASDGVLGANIIFSMPKEEPAYTQWILPWKKYTLSVTAMDAAFIDENGAMYYISDNDQLYYVIVDGVIVRSGVSLDGPVGHANNCNYIDGKVYISAWLPNVKRVIHVFNVNTSTLTLTYAYDITVPLDDDDGATQYIVLSEEKQIIGIGMTGDYKAMKFTLWTKSNDTYIKSREFTFPMFGEQTGWIQGMTLVNNKIYYVCGKEPTYTHIGIGILDIDTGIAEFLPAFGEIMNTEIEAIIYVRENVFYCVDAGGRVYLQYIAHN